LFAVRGLVRVGADWVAEIKAERVCPESRVNHGEIFFGDGFRIIAVFFIEAFFESIVHSVDGDFAVVVAVHSVDIGLLDEEENQKERTEKSDDDKFDNGKAFFIHRVIIT